MAFGDWDKIIQVYRTTYLNSKYGDHAQAMIDLIPSIRSLPEFEGVMPGTSHGTLFFSVADRVETLNVVYAIDGIYTIYLDHPITGEISRWTATAQNVLPVLQTSIKQLKTMAENV